MSFVRDLQAIAEDRSAAQAAKLHAHSVATSIVLGLMVARLEELHPGSREQMLSQVDAMAAHISADAGTSADVVAEVAKHARMLLRTSSI